MAKHPCPDCGINLSVRHVCKPVTACLTCGRHFHPRLRASQRYCSTACSNRRSVDPASPMLDRRTRYLAKSRARRLQQALTWDGVSDDQILDRDGWRCHICHRKIKPTPRNPHPKSRSIDHIVPLSEGGDDTAANKRAAHLGCNMARGNRGGHEQLMLIGWTGPTPLAPVVTAGRLTSTRQAKAQPLPCPRCPTCKQPRPERRHHDCRPWSERGPLAARLRATGMRWADVSAQAGFGDGTGACYLAASKHGDPADIASWPRDPGWRAS
jgi:hypothetical protein